MSPPNISEIRKETSNSPLQVISFWQQVGSCLTLTRANPTSPPFRANPSTEGTDRICRLPLPTFLLDWWPLTTRTCCGLGTASLQYIYYTTCFLKRFISTHTCMLWICLAFIKLTNWFRFSHAHTHTQFFVESVLLFLWCVVFFCVWSEVLLFNVAVRKLVFKGIWIFIRRYKKTITLSCTTFCWFSYSLVFTQHPQTKKF